MNEHVRVLVLNVCSYLVREAVNHLGHSGQNPGHVRLRTVASISSKVIQLSRND
jgi:hypothetical protein